MKIMESNRSGRPVALITGGSGGIGFALAKQFAHQGHDLVLVARDDVRLARAAGDLEGQYPHSAVTTICLDLATDDAPAGLFRQLKAKGIPVDVLVNNAGVSCHGPFAGCDPGRLSSMIRLNILALTELTRQFLPNMIQRGQGRILNVASLVAFFAGGPDWSAYVASKHYVRAFTRGLRGELAGSGVTVTALCPGPAATDLAGRSAVGRTRLYRWLPMVDLSAIARDAYHATMAGRSVVVPGLLNKILALLGELPPRGVAEAVLALLLKGDLARRQSKNHVS